MIREIVVAIVKAPKEAALYCIYGNPEYRARKYRIKKAEEAAKALPPVADKDKVYCRSCAHYTVPGGRSSNHCEHPSNIITKVRESAAERYEFKDHAVSYETKNRRNDCKDYEGVGVFKKASNDASTIAQKQAAADALSEWVSSNVGLVRDYNAWAEENNVSPLVGEALNFNRNRRPR